MNKTYIYVLHSLLTHRVYLCKSTGIYWWFNLEQSTDQTRSLLSTWSFYELFKMESRIYRVQKNFYWLKMFFILNYIINITIMSENIWNKKFIFILLLDTTVLYNIRMKHRNKILNKIKHIFLLFYNPLFAYSAINSQYYFTNCF